jgi:arsenate reductase-like glutaredoxin family protein
MTIQIFGVKNSQATRAAERFFKERRTPVQFVDLQKKPMSPGEIKRFIDRFTLPALTDRDNPSIKYLRLSDSELLNKIEQDPKLLHLPLVRSAKILSIGHDEASWKAMLGIS